MKADSIGNRMKKNYEFSAQSVLVRRMPVIVRVDGRAFHTLTRKMQKPFDQSLNVAMQFVTDGLMSEMQGSKLAYMQSDEVSVLLTDYDTLKTEPWFGYNVQKMVSIAAARATAEFNIIGARFGWPIAMFDARVFNIPKEEVENYFLWRIQDAERNSLNAYCHAVFGHRALQNKNRVDKLEMLRSAGMLDQFNQVDQNILFGRLSTRQFGVPGYRTSLADLCKSFREEGLL